MQHASSQQAETSSSQSSIHDALPVSELASLNLDDSPQPSSRIPSGDSQLEVSSSDITYRNYRDEDDIKVIVDLIAPYLSEPYSIYCYRYFLHGW